MKNYKLPKEFAQKWVNALRSGEYKQTQKCFTKGQDCFCALGLGYFILGCEPKKNKQGGWNLLGIHNDQMEILNPLFDEITTINDSGKSFLEAANWIEANVEFI